MAPKRAAQGYAPTGRRALSHVHGSCDDDYTSKHATKHSLPNDDASGSDAADLLKTPPRKRMRQTAAPKARSNATANAKPASADAETDASDSDNGDSDNSLGHEPLPSSGGSVSTQKYLRALHDFKEQSTKKPKLDIGVELDKRIATEVASLKIAVDEQYHQQQIDDNDFHSQYNAIVRGAIMAATDECETTPLPRERRELSNVLAKNPLYQASRVCVGYAQDTLDSYTAACKLIDTVYKDVALGDNWQSHVDALVERVDTGKSIATFALQRVIEPEALGALTKGVLAEMEVAASSFKVALPDWMLDDSVRSWHALTRLLEKGAAKLERAASS